jgi:hypothetical protein
MNYERNPYEMPPLSSRHDAYSVADSRDGAVPWIRNWAEGVTILHLKYPEYYELLANGFRLGTTIWKDLSNGKYKINREEGVYCINLAQYRD